MAQRSEQLLAGVLKADKEEQQYDADRCAYVDDLRLNIDRAEAEQHANR